MLHPNSNTYILEIRHRDRPDQSPIAHLLVEREEKYRYSQDNEIMDAVIKLRYQRLGPHRPGLESKGYFCGCYSKRYNRASLTASLPFESGGVFLDLSGLHGQRIGTYLLNTIVEWLQQWPDASVNTIELVEGQGHGSNKLRRNRLYEQFGIEFDFTSSKQQAGHSRPIHVGQLTPVTAWKANITERSLTDYMREILAEKQHLSEEFGYTDRLLKSYKVRYRQAEARPLWFAVKTLYRRHRDLLWSSSFFAVIAAVLWVKWKSLG
ncbi:hypothetical protein H0A36_17705 [Endozoicomonas sp. SM1973]|uniref:Uncharacterized protein n=1 Tax=Spartinivicinus marinus TaxID=2994442 RepID=A0A853I380_9GAMM|nr:hypothetical protein [Spartinivicinus marinus]MCX4030210.1 hypothetical protein [Spartinivicinus marinus]NYZ67853.1 hypothetical protein [Spartinivicinus marinus]